MGRIARQTNPRTGPDILVLDRTNADFFVASNYVVAVADSQSRGGLALDMKDHGFVDVTIEVTVAGSATAISVAVRSTSQIGAEVGTDAVWSRMNRTQDVDLVTGFDTGEPLQTNIPLTTAKVGRYTISLPVTNRFVSVVVWADLAGTRGRVYMARRP